MNNSLTYRERMRHIIDYAYTLFCNQVAGGLIEVENEASMQLFLSDILLQLGRLNVFSTDENFNMRLEKKLQLSIPTSKSKNGKTRIDIWMELGEDKDNTCAAAIELKYLKKSVNAAVTDDRHAVYKDLENLEQYADLRSDLIICEIIYSDNSNFAERKGTKFSIADDTVLSSYDGDSTYGRITLVKRYHPINWDRLGDHNFLKITPIEN
ncbi:MAG: hypothetical protein HDR89_01455 [Bacteroides sp.]|nr:hypothetical protein [Bacteroides sp.]